MMPLFAASIATYRSLMADRKRPTTRSPHTGVQRLLHSGGCTFTRQPTASNGSERGETQRFTGFDHGPDAVSGDAAQPTNEGSPHD